MGKLWALVLAGSLVSGCAGIHHRYTYVSAQSSGPAKATAWHQPTTDPRARAELYQSQAEWERARARRERRRWEAETSYRRWYNSLTEEEREKIRQRERELNAMLDALARHAS